MLFCMPVRRVRSDLVARDRDPLTTDLRGELRDDSMCDVGSVEVQAVGYW